MDSGPAYVRTRLSVMMFLEFFVWACWFTPISSYGPITLQLTMGQMGWVFSATALGAIISPLFIGYVADRLFSTERVLCVLHLIGAVCMILAAGVQQGEFPKLMTLLMINALCFMPTLALANSLAFRNIPDPEKFPHIAVLGTIGWIVSGVVVDTVFGGGTARWFFYLAGGAGIVMALYCLTLPHTPPKGPEETGGDVLGFGAIRLLKEPAFLLFVFCAFLITIPSTFYFVGCHPMLVQTGRPVPTALMTLSQVSEIFVMFTMPLFIARLGLNRVLAIGMGAWAIRYVCFSTLSFPLILLALLLHGFCYSFVFVGAYIYVDKKAPRDLRASAQSLIAFLMLGVGWFIGAQICGRTMDRYPPLVKNMPATQNTAEGVKKIPEASLPTWAAPGAATSLWRYLNLSATIKGWFSEEQGPATSDIGQKLDTAPADGRITLAELQQVPQSGLQLGANTYAKQDLINVFRRIDGHQQVRTKADFRAVLQDTPTGELRVTRSQWVEAQSYQWPRIWVWPAGMALVVCALFWLGSRATEPSGETDKKAEASPEQH
jgi:nucleoside transporter